MPTYEVLCRKPVEHILEAKSPHEAAQKFRDKIGQIPGMVNGLTVAGTCHACGEVLFYNLDSFYMGDDEGLIHKACSAEAFDPDGGQP